MTCSPAHRVHCSPAHEALVAEYRDARQWWEDAFEAGTNETYRPGIIGEQRLASRRGGRNEVVDFVEASPPVTFRAWLEGNAGRNRDPLAE
jgi:hypothetical protein